MASLALAAILGFVIPKFKQFIENRWIDHILCAVRENCSLGATIVFIHLVYTIFLLVRPMLDGR